MEFRHVELGGFAAPRFAPAQDALARAIAGDGGRGAQLAARLNGDPVVDLWGGFADRAGREPLGPHTLLPVYSATKPVAALVIALLVERAALSYDTKVAELWPDFAAAGKGAVTVAQALTHQAGLPGFARDWAAEDWLDSAKTRARLAAMAAMWPLGQGSGYHPITWGALAGAIAEAASGRTIGTILREDIAGPEKIAFWIGLPEAEQSRVAEMTLPRGTADFGAITPEKTAAFLSPWSGSGRAQSAAWRAAELPAANGHGTAMAMAQLAEPFAREGRLGARALLSPAVVAEATRIRVAGPDRVLPYDVAFAPGLFCARPGAPAYGPGARTVGHTGWGGSFLFADPDAKLTAGFAMTRQNPTLYRDARMEGLIAALYRGL